MESKRVSIIVPTYNRMFFLNRAIQSILEQDYQNFELLIVDDNSSDDTEGMVDAISDQRIRYLRHQKNKGAAAARNTGIDHASGDFVAFLDSDDEWKKNMLSTHLSIWEKSNPEVIQFSKLIMDNGLTEKVFPVCNYKKEDHIAEYLFYNNGLISTITMFMPLSIANQIKFDPSLKKHQDYDFVLKAFDKGIKFRMIEKVLAVWHCEERKDRMGQGTMYEYSVNWMERNKSLFTKRSAKAFVQRDVIPQIARDKFSLKAALFLGNIFQKNYISVTTFLNNLIRLFIINPQRLFKRK